MQYPVLDNNGHVNDLVQQHVRNLDDFSPSCTCGRRQSPPHLHLRICTTRTPGTSTTLSSDSNCGTSTDFSTKNTTCAITGLSPRAATAEHHGQHCLDQNPRLAQTGKSTLSKNWTAPPDDVHNRDIVHLVKVLQLRNLHSNQHCNDPAPVVV